MRSIIYSLIIFSCGAAYADNVIVQYQPDYSREEMELKLTSFGLIVASYWEFIHGGLIVVPCREAERWVRVLNEIKGVKIAEHDFLVSAGSASPSSIPTCVPESEAIYNTESETLEVPQLYLDNKVYRVELTPPFNIQELELIDELNIYPYD